MSPKKQENIPLIQRAFNATRHEIFVSLKLLIITTLILAAAMWWAESRVNTDYGIVDALIWTFVKYVEDPADIVEPPVTMLGQVIGTLVGVIGIAIFAIPTGLISSGLTSAMEEEKHENEIKEYHQRISKSFRRSANKTLRDYLNSLPDKGGDKFARINITPQYQPMARIQVRQAINQIDIFEVCNSNYFDNLRLKNLAEAKSLDHDADDRIVVEHFPINRLYGCCINRNSKITIISTSSSIECSTGWWAYYLAKFGGFNYISKDLEADSDEIDSFFNMSAEPLYEKKSRKEISPKSKNYKQIISILNNKEQFRQKFLNDIKQLCTGDDSWVILVSTQVLNKSNTTELHLASCKNDGTAQTIKDVDRYERFTKHLQEKVADVLNFTIATQSSRYPLTKNNLLYRLQREGILRNGFVMRPASQFINFDNRNLVGAFIIAQLLSEEFDQSKGISNEDVKDLATTGYGYRDYSKDIV